MVEGVAGCLEVAPAIRRKLDWKPALGRLRWPNGSEAQLFSGDNADGLRGPEHHFAWCDELAKWRQAEKAWDNLQLGAPARAAAAGAGDDDAAADAAARADPGCQRTVTTPAGRATISIWTRFIEVMTATYAGTRLGAQELDGNCSRTPRGAVDRGR